MKRWTYNPARPNDDQPTRDPMRRDRPAVPYTVRNRSEGGRS